MCALRAQVWADGRPFAAKLGASVYQKYYRGLGLPGLPFNLEYIGFVCFLCALGRLLAQHSFEPKTACGN